MSDQSTAGAVASVAAQSSISTGIQLNMAMLKKSKEVMEQQAQATLQLVDSMPKPVGSLGHNIDVKA